MSNFDDAIDFVLKNEGGLSDNPRDKGSITHYGISLRFLRSLGRDRLRSYSIYEDPDEQTIKDLTVDQAKKIYHEEFWVSAPFHEIANQMHCNYIFDMAINCGISPAIKAVQRACWAVMKRWESLVDDGVLGQETILAIQMCGMFLMPAFRAERGNYYRNIVNAHPDQKEFLAGWYNRTYNT